MDKQQIYIANQSLEKLPETLEQFRAKRIFLVTGKKSFSLSGAEQRIKSLVAGWQIHHFSDFSVNPKLEDIQKGIQEFKEFSPEIVLVIGGGSPIDIAKTINILAFHNADPREYILKERDLERPGLPLIAVPTTAGTGSEATHFAVAYIDGVKYSLAHPAMLPDVALIDPSLTLNLPRYISASTGADALSQAIESYWSVQATQESKAWAKKAIMLAIKNLKKTVLNPDVEARTAMMQAAHLAGRAIDISKTTACHALSYPFTIHFKIPHGHAVVLTLSSILSYNSQVKDDDCADQRGPVYVRETMNELFQMLGAKSGEAAAKILHELFQEIGLELRLSKLGITQKDIELILSEASLERMKNNPRLLNTENTREILSSIL
ncbi:MAG: phosphonoacetaldehyde reductase [Candidatus Harrisonbacteria bacterium]|nr:phosphonoacetaldehyde reductase [Candidatus Harrisonbacteria bacterium]